MLQKDVLKNLSSRNIRVGAEFEFKISPSKKKKLKKDIGLSIAYYEYEVYVKQLERYFDEKRKTLPKLPYYAEKFGYVSGDDIPDPDDILNKPKSKFHRLIDNFLYIRNWPIPEPKISINRLYKNSQEWIMKPDWSLGNNGVELVTPIMTLNQFKNLLPKILKCIHKYGKTDTKCGLHISISISNIKKLRDVLDPEKLITFIDEKYIFKHFPSRRNNEFCYSMHKNIKDNNEFYGKKKVNKNHYMAVNLRHLRGKNQYIEFRYLGGPKYEMKYKYIKRVLAMYIYSFKMACNNKKIGEYNQRLDEIIYDF